MKPYYEQDGISIYHGDCRDMPEVEGVDLLLTDPPYGIDLDPSWTERVTKGSGRGYVGWAKDHPPVIGDDLPFDPAPWLKYPNAVLFGANYFADRLPPASCWIVWDKKRGGTVTPGWNSTDAELAWTTFSGGVRVFSHLWGGYKRESEIGFHVHPTQKPVSLMRWILDRWTQPGDLILDPYMGSGPVAQACHEMDRRYIGVEIVEDYCKIAVQRLAQGVLSFGEV